MNGMIGTIALRELRERALRKGYLLGTAATILIVVAAIALPTMFGGDGPTEHHVGVVGDAGLDLQAALPPMLPEDRTLTVTTFADVDTARSAILDGEVEAVLVDGRELLVDGSPPPMLRGAFDFVLQQARLTQSLAQAGLNDEEIAAVLAAPVPLQIVNIGEDEDESAFFVAFIATILLVVGVQMSGATLLSGALEEKSNRVVEILVSAARPWQLLTGKVLATSLLSFIQLTLIVVAALATNHLVEAFPLPPVTGNVLAISLVMLLAGYLFYAALFTVAGTLAASMEDAQSTAGPLYFVMWGAYAAVFITVLPNPSGVIAQTLTLLPPTAPFIVPARVALGDIAAWQIPASIVLTLIGALFTVKIAGRLYAASVLTGGRVTWKAAWKSEPVR